MLLTIFISFSGLTISAWLGEDTIDFSATRNFVVSGRRSFSFLGFLRWVALFYCDTLWAVHITILNA